jgi:hypothetical protein
MTLPETLKKAMELLTSPLAARGNAAQLAKKLMPLIAEAQHMTESGMMREARRGTGRIEYVVEKTQQGEVLTERRLSGNSQPFRCPKSIYEVVAKVLATADRPLLVDEIVARVELLVGERPPDFQVRLLLRFWLHAGSPLVIRSRARYRLADPKAFIAQAARLWSSLRTS